MPAGFFHSSFCHIFYLFIILFCSFCITELRIGFRLIMPESCEYGSVKKLIFTHYKFTKLHRVIRTFFSVHNPKNQSPVSATAVGSTFVKLKAEKIVAETGFVMNGIVCAFNLRFQALQIVFSDEIRGIGIIKFNRHILTHLSLSLFYNKSCLFSRVNRTNS